MWSGPCQQLALATVLDAPHGPRPTHEHVRKTSPVTCCASAVTDTSPTCALWGSRTVCGPEQSYRGGRGGRHRTLDSGDLSAAVWVSIAVCSSQYPSSCRVATRAAVGGRRSAKSDSRWARKYAYFFTHRTSQNRNRQPRTVSLLSSVPSRLRSPKSSERAQSPISRGAPSSPYRRAGIRICGRGWVVRCPCFNFDLRY